MTDVRSVPARYYARLCDVLEDMGIASRPLLQDAGVDVNRIQVPDGSLTMAEVEALLAAASEASGRSDLGLELGRALKLTSHSAVSYAILSSPTLGYCLNLVARFFSLILPSFRMRYATDTRFMQLTVEPLWSMSHACLAFHLELIMSAVHWEVREILGGNLAPYQLYLSLHPPPYAARYAQFREQRTHFAGRVRPGFRVECPVEVASRPLALADPTALQLAEQRCSEMLRQARAAGDVAGWVSMMLREATGEPPSLTELAHTLNLSARTLDRYLRKEGTSFRALSRQACYQRACDLLPDPQLSVTQIAYELGYTDVSNFARAFRRESGSSPSAWRAAQME